MMPPESYFEGRCAVLDQSDEEFLEYLIQAMLEPLKRSECAS